VKDAVMRLGIHVSDFTYPSGPKLLAADLTRIAQDADAGGVTSLTVMDHFFQITVVGPPEMDMLEAYTTLGFLAAKTERLELGVMVTGVTYRHPGLLAKIVTTLDVLSEGRAFLGIGAAWNEEEHRGLGVPFPPLKERFERLEETLQIVRQMWAGDESAYVGEHYRLERPMNSPQSLQRPHPPILIGGTGERKTLRMVAQYADACNIFEMIGLPEIQRKLEVLRGHCTDLGRDYDEIERTTTGPLILTGAPGAPADAQQSVDQAVDRFGRLAAIGVEHAHVIVAGVHDEKVRAQVNQVAQQIAGITAAGR
jgi:F420-dependent oxidoreductase-like protein